MILSSAISTACRRAKRIAEHVFVVYEAEEYELATERELDTWFATATVIGSASPSGAWEAA